MKTFDSIFLTLCCRGDSDYFVFLITCLAATILSCIFVLYFIVGASLLFAGSTDAKRPCTLSLATIVMSEFCVFAPNFSKSRWTFLYILLGESRDLGSSCYVALRRSKNDLP